MNGELGASKWDEHAPLRQDHQVTRPAQRWALSPLGSCVHLVSGAGQFPGELEARCGHQLPAGATQHDRPPPGPPCENCHQIFLVDFEVAR